jgi:pyruvate-formate lyase-activating enzyme
LDKQGSKTEIRIPYVPNYNDKEIHQIGKFLSSLKHLIKVRILPYHNYASSKYKSLDIKNTLPPSLPNEAEIENAIKKLTAYNLNVI